MIDLHVPSFYLIPLHSFWRFFFFRIMENLFSCTQFQFFVLRQLPVFCLSSAYSTSHHIPSIRPPSAIIKLLPFFCRLDATPCRSIHRLIAFSLPFESNYASIDLHSSVSWRDLLSKNVGHSTFTSISLWWWEWAGEKRSGFFFRVGH